MEKWLILELGQETYNMSLEHLVPESKRMLVKQTESPYNDGHVKETQAPTQRASSGQRWNEPSNTKSKMTLAGSPNCKHIPVRPYYHKQISHVEEFPIISNATPFSRRWSTTPHSAVAWAW